MSAMFARRMGIVMIWSALILIGGTGLSAANAAEDESLGRSRTAAELSADWWKWAIELPDEDHPLTTEGEVDCSIGQQGPIWFLAGITGGSGAVVRSCEVPLGKSLFFPLVNSAWMNEEGENASVQMKRDVLEWVFTPFPNGLTCNFFSSVNGVSTVQSSIVTARTQSETFSATANNSVLFPPGTHDDEAVSDGYWVTLPPLGAGQHEVRFGGALCGEDGEPFFALDVTYHLTIPAEEE